MTLRAVFHEEDDAQAVASRLARDGFETEVVPERFAGEDDDEDHAWAVVTDAPEFVLEILCDEHDGWLDHGETPDVGGYPDAKGVNAPGAPLDLPDAPRRVKGHFPGLDGPV